MSTHVVILAAGEGKRMMSDLPKVAHLVAGRPMIHHVIDAFGPTNPESMVVVVGHGADVVTSMLPTGVTVAIQPEQRGTGQATQVGLDAVQDLADGDTVVIAYGDMPLLTSSLVERLANRPPGVKARMVTADFDDPKGYGRVIRDSSDAVVAVVEERDCTPEQRAITEVNAGAYSFEAGSLIPALKEVMPANTQEEFYLTDVVGILVADGQRVEPVTASPEEVVGINSQDQLAEATRLMQKRVVAKLAESGVWILDPERTYVDETVTIEPGARLYPGVHLEGATSVGAGARVGPDVTAVDSAIGANSTVWYSVLREAVVGDDCEVGPFASLRKGTVLADRSKAGSFVETKNSTLGKGSKLPHLSYLGDATVGERTNIGAGTITCNYDGLEKHATEIGDEAFIGSDTMLVAPVRVGDRATTGAGSVISKDVADGALAVERSEQREIPGYADTREKRRAARREAED